MAERGSHGAGWGTPKDSWTTAHDACSVVLLSRSRRPGSRIPRAGLRGGRASGMEASSFKGTGELGGPNHGVPKTSAVKILQKNA